MECKSVKVSQLIGVIDVESDVCDSFILGLSLDFLRAMGIEIVLSIALRHTHTYRAHFLHSVTRDFVLSRTKAYHFHFLTCSLCSNEPG
jgi:hypothetical protein